MGSIAFQPRSIRWVISLMGLGVFAFTCLRLYYHRDQEVVESEKAADEQRIQEEQEMLKEHQFQESIQNIMNATLGFNKILAINMPSRTDKRDQLVLGSSLTGFVIDFIDGVDPKDLNSKVYPYNWNPGHSSTEYACLRAHLNAAQRIVQHGLRTALVLEDDVDWDLSIKPQLQTFAHAVRSLQGTTQTTTESPYGDEWDLLWLGHCGASCKTESPFYMIPNDPTVASPAHLPKYYHFPPENVRPDTTRLVCTLNDAACTSAYAMSYRGAQRILAALSVNPSGFADRLQTGDQIDIELGRMCKSGLLKCFAPFPALTGTYQSAGLSSKGTDQSGHNREATMEPATSWGVVYSTLLNIKHILQGERVVHATWPDVDNPIVNPEDVHFESGYMYTYHPEDHPAPVPIPEEDPFEDISFEDETIPSVEPESINEAPATEAPHQTNEPGFQDIS